MAGIETITATLQRDSLHTPWGFRLQGGADFCVPFSVNKITAGSPADGVLHRGDIILEINQRPISSMYHGEVLELVQKAGGQITFLIKRGHGPLPPSVHGFRPTSAMPWSVASAASYIEKNFHLPTFASNAPLSPTNVYRSRALERIPDPKPILSQTGSPLMPGPVPSVSTKTRGFTKPPAFRTEPGHFGNVSSPYALNSPVRHADQGSVHHFTWKDGSSYEPNSYIPSYQKKVSNDPRNSRTYQQYTTITRTPQQYRPTSVQPTNLVHRQYNSPMSLYSNENIQDAMKHNVSHITRVSIVPSMPNHLQGNYTTTAAAPSHNIYTTATTPICYVQPKQQNVFASDY